MPFNPQKGRLAWFGWAAALAAIIIAVYLGYHSFLIQLQLDQERGRINVLAAQVSRAQELMDALTSPEAKHLTLTETRQPAQPIGHAIYLKKSGALIFIANNLHPISSNKTYELWLIPANSSAPIPAGLFHPDSRGTASIVLPSLPSGIEAKAFRVTVEQAQGSETPTLPIVMAGQ